MTDDPLMIARLALALLDRLDALPAPHADPAATAAFTAARPLDADPGMPGSLPAADLATAAHGGAETPAGWREPLLSRSVPGRVVLISSARAGEGKSFVARLLQAALAAQPPYAGQVGLIDGDLRDGGPADRVAGWPPAARAAGGGRPLPPAAAGLLFQAAAVRQTLASLRRRHAVTLVDGTPLADCGALAQQADAVLLVVDARRTPRRSIERALASARVDPARLAGVVLNRREAGLPRWLGAD